jgi:hypothetical protein
MKVVSISTCKRPQLMADHAQWDIKLGDDANMKSITAKFGGHDLKVTSESDKCLYKRS